MFDFISEPFGSFLISALLIGLLIFSYRKSKNKFRNYFRKSWIILSIIAGVIIAVTFIGEWHIDKYTEEYYVEQGGLFGSISYEGVEESEGESYYCFYSSGFFSGHEFKVRKDSVSLPLLTHIYPTVALVYPKNADTTHTTPDIRRPIKILVNPSTFTLVAGIFTFFAILINVVICLLGTLIQCIIRRRRE